MKILSVMWAGAILSLSWPCLAHTSPLTYSQKCIHLLDRLTFGPKPGDLARIYKLGPKVFIEEQLNPDQINDSNCEKELENYPTLKMSSYDLFKAYPPAQFVLKKPNWMGLTRKKLKPSTRNRRPSWWNFPRPSSPESSTANASSRKS